MPIFLDTRGNTTLGIAVCPRCARKRPIDKLGIDPNIGPGVLYCLEGAGTPSGCIDQLDPWRLPARQPDKIALRYSRPDTPLVADQIGVMTESGDGYLETQDGDEWILPDG